MNDENYWFDEEINDGLEYNAYERMGGQIYDEAIIRPSTKDDVNVALFQRFTTFIGIVANDMNSSGVITVSNEEIQYILKQAGRIPNPTFKNPTGFVLGYWLTRKGIIDKKRFDKLKTELDQLNYPLKDVDLVRYANLWLVNEIY